MDLDCRHCHRHEKYTVTGRRANTAEPTPRPQRSIWGEDLVKLPLLPAPSCGTVVDPCHGGGRVRRYRLELLFCFSAHSEYQNCGAAVSYACAGFRWQAAPRSEEALRPVARQAAAGLLEALEEAGRAGADANDSMVCWRCFSTIHAKDRPSSKLPLPLQASWERPARTSPRDMQLGPQEIVSVNPRPASIVWTSGAPHAIGPGAVTMRRRGLIAMHRNWCVRPHLSTPRSPQRARDDWSTSSPEN